MYRIHLLQTAEDREVPSSSWSVSIPSETAPSELHSIVPDDEIPDDDVSEMPSSQDDDEDDNANLLPKQKEDEKPALSRKIVFMAVGAFILLAIIIFAIVYPLTCCCCRTDDTITASVDAANVFNTNSSNITGTTVVGTPDDGDDEESDMSTFMAQDNDNNDDDENNENDNDNENNNDNDNDNNEDDNEDNDNNNNNNNNYDNDNTSNNDNNIYVVNHTMNDNTTTIQELYMNDNHTTTTLDVKDPLVKEFFNVSLPKFSHNITEKYSSGKQLDKDLSDAATFLLNKSLKRNIGTAGYEFVGLGSAANGGGLDMMGDDPTPSRRPPPTLTDFRTNNQEGGVDEADVIKANENYVFAAYGDFLLVWDIFGNQITELQMLPFQEESSSSSKPKIESLMLMDDGYLVVFLSQEQPQQQSTTILQDYLSLQIRTYRTTTLPIELEFVGSKRVHGRFLDARSIGNNLHLATVSAIDTHSSLVAPLDREIFFPTLTDEEYLVVAQQHAAEMVIPEFVARLRDELSAVSNSGNDDEFPNMLRINRWQTTTTTSEESTAVLDDMAFGEGVANYVSFITSLDVTNELMTNGGGVEELQVFTSSFVSPSSWISMYGTLDKLILATQGWNWNPTHQALEQTTYLLGLEMDGPTTNFMSVGIVSGHFLNTFALDIVGNDLRVATTIRKGWRIQPLPDPDPPAATENNNNTMSTMSVNGTRKSNRYNRVRSPVAQPIIEQTIIIPAQQEQQQEQVVEEVSLTENYVIILDLDDDSQIMMERGRVRIGERNEEITAIRFFDHVAYVTTFRRSDPFYVIDLQTPSILGEFKLDGFSSYLHSMNANNTLLIGVGRNATRIDVAGRVLATGLMITVFDASIPESPVALTSHSLASSSGDSSSRSGGSSTVLWEHKSFRYFNDKLIIPLTENMYNNERGVEERFEGFVIFNITETSIVEYFRVSHRSRFCHYCDGYLPPRSLLYNGNLMTMQDSVVTSTNLYNASELWTMDIEVSNDDDEPPLCCPSTVTTNFDTHHNDNVGWEANIQSIIPTGEEKDPFPDIDLAFFSQNITRAYPNPTDFDSDLAYAAMFLLNNAIKRYLNVPGYGNVGVGSAFNRGMLNNIMTVSASPGNGAAPMPSPTSRGSAAAAHYFQANEQEKSINEADIVRADETFVYAAYGDYIVVWDKQSGNRTTQLKMPDIPVTKGSASYKPRPRVESLILTSGHLVVFVSGYGRSLMPDQRRSTLLYDYLGTQIRTYRTSTLPEELEFVGMINVHGRFLHARTTTGSSNVHLVTTSGIDTFNGLIGAIDRYMRFPSVSDDEYLVAAKQAALDRVIPEFVGRLREELVASSGGHFPKMLQLNRWQTENEKGSSQLLDIAYGEGIVNNIAFITSFDVTGALSRSFRTDYEELEVSTSCFLSPSSWIRIYGTSDSDDAEDDRIIVATRGWNWDPTLGGQEQSTYLLTLQVEGASTRFVSVGTVPGYLVNPYSLNIHGNDLRVATTISSRWIFRPVPLAMDVQFDREANNPYEQISSPTGTGTILLPTEEVSAESYVVVLDLENDDTTTDGQMVERGRVEVESEVITSIRFFHNIAYAGASERTGPFYVISLQTPAKLGEFKLSGFSTHLHSMNGDNTLLIGVGLNVTREGDISTGCMVTIFNASVPELPVAIVSHTIEAERELEHTSFRYIDGNLIIAMREMSHTIDGQTGTSQYDRFQGFVVLNVTATSIEEHFRVSHSARGDCQYCGGEHLEPRSFIFGANLMTIEDNVVTTTNFDNASEVWTMDIVIDDETTDCC